MQDIKPYKAVVLAEILQEFRRALWDRKDLTGERWCYLMGVEMIDDDGFRNGCDFHNDPISFEDFQSRLHDCTVNPREIFQP